MLREAAARVADPTAGAAADRAARARLHASCVQVGGIGVVLLGASGSGKSDLALRLIDAGGRLVADDRLEVERIADGLIGHAPEALGGLIEVRGLGIVRIDHCASSPLGLVVELDGAGPWPRLPERTTYELMGIALPHVRLDPRAPSACAKIRLALRAERIA
jgi:serine kinase of HPr protein (carbohydrate metabolism regulator)